MIQIIKRDGIFQDFDKNKIIQAILKAFLAVDGETSEYAVQKAENIANYIYDFTLKESPRLVDVEEIQSLCEKGLMATKRKDVAKAYILYRDKRNAARGNVTDKTFREFLAGKSDYWNTENSNKDATTVTVQRDYIAGIASTDIARRFLLPKEVCEAHDTGIIHQHDMDYMAQKALTNCALLNIDDILTNGTVINGVRIDSQKRLSTAITVTTQAITAAASSMYGGTTITLTHLAPYVRMSFALHYRDGLRFIEKKTDDEIDYEIDNMLKDSRQYHIDNREYQIYSPAAYEYAMAMLEKEVRDAVQTFNYQINSMSTTNGQAPFLSVFMWINEDPEYSTEVAMLIKEFLHQRIRGMKNEKGIYVTQAFPKLLYCLDENNIREGTQYWDLTRLAAECTAKRMVPDYISALKMRELKGSVYPCMGCRSFLTPDTCEENYAKALNYRGPREKYYGRLTA